MGINTGIGIGIGIPFKNNALGGDNMYFPPELKARIIGVWDNYGKKNTDADRNIIKNKIPNAGGDLEILNAAYEGMSGCNGYPVVFGANETWENLSSVHSYTSDVTSTTIHITRVENAGTGLLFSYVKKDGALTNIREIPAFRVTVKGLEGNSKFGYRYLATEDATVETLVYLGNGTHELSKSFTPTEALLDLTRNAWVGIFITPMVEGEVVFDCDITIEVLPEYEGAFVTDGVNDMIISQKTIAEMGITDEVTVVSMIHQIDLNSTYTIATTNYIENSNSREHVRSDVYNYGKTGIYGYSASLINNTKSDIKNILGDEADYYVKSTNSLQAIFDAKFSVVGRTSELSEASQVAWYWTIIANKVLTTDQINQVIAYFNLDRTLKPDILCNTIKQGITNENHAEFGNKLIDFSGNGRDIQLNNLAWDGNSGIGKYNYPNWKVTVTIANTYSTIVNYPTVNGTYSINVNGVSELMQSIGLHLEIKYTTSTGIIYNDIEQDGVYSYILPDGATNLTLRFGGIPGIVNEPCNITITQIPSHAGALCLDGVNDFGKVTGMPIYKDYTFIIEREFLNKTFPNQVCLASKSKSAEEGENGGAFIIDNISVNSIINPYSFYKTTSLPGLNTFDRQVVFQSKYKYLDKDIAAGTATDSDTLWLGTFRDNDSRFANVAIYSLMSFPYSMSKFLIERQLKKHKLGTLYPNMVEFRPVIKANANYKITYYQIDSTNTWKSIKVADHIVIGAKLAFQITFDNDASELKEVVSPQLSGIIVEKRLSNPGYNIYSYITSKSPQKINITIDEYIRYEDIVQPYPVVFQIKDRNTNQIYNYGDKIKVGSSIQLTQGENPNLLSGLYRVQSYEYEGETYTYDQLKALVIIITKSGIQLSCNKVWTFDDNEPKCILSPRLLRIPNSSYKILGYIPDISGNGNHGILHNSAYIEGSGVNEDGSYQLDGVNDFVTIPTLSNGGKQVLMKVNWGKTIAYAILYDQRSYPNEFAICNADVDDNNNPVFAYQARNNGQTYIDGILNKNIKASELSAITHNITITNELSTGTNTSSPVIGSKIVHDAYFTNMALYDFMLFDNISTDDKIKELNEYVGIEAKVELPPYYWDAYGKTNLDEDKATIQQRGVAVGDYDLTNYNHAYNKMSGYGGYAFAKFDNTSEWIYTNNSDTIEVVNRDGYDVVLRKVGNGTNYWHFRNTIIKSLGQDIQIGVYANKSVRIVWQLKYKLEGETDYNTLAIASPTIEGNINTYVTLPYKTKQEIADLNAVDTYYSIYFIPIDLDINEEVTIEMLPLYPNGLVYDGVTDYSENTNIPAFTDYTYIFKRDILGFNHRSVSMHKGTSTNHSRAFTSDYDYGETNEVLAYSFGSSIATPNATSKKIIYGTKTSVDGQPITPGSSIDDAGLFIGKWYDDFFKKMVFYKLILYPKTIPLLQINFLKNLMERDEIIDLDNPIFKK